MTLLNKFKYLAGNVGVGADIATIHFPIAQLFYRCILGWRDDSVEVGLAVKSRPKIYRFYVVRLAPYSISGRCGRLLTHTSYTTSRDTT
ncbi:MAG TPA: hypothetical protein VKG22_09695 [Stellaceae bacterium]|nr:hypothetical protein [Stellaceae bacterium]